jgi:hypothetical protein
MKTKFVRITVGRVIRQVQDVVVEVPEDATQNEAFNAAVKKTHERVWEMDRLERFENLGASTTNPVKSAVAAIRAVADSHDNETCEHVEPEDREGMLEMYRGDARDLRKVADLVEALRFKAAHEKAWSMDTAARECIPDEAWQLIHANTADLY